jgi:hypothetical protein
MTHTSLQLLKTAAAAAILVALPLAHAANMSKDEYKAAKSQITDTYKSDKDGCASLAGNAKDICVEEAKGKQKVALADLEFRYSGKTSDQNKLWVAKADAAYDVAKEKCDDLAGNPKDVCVKEAKAAHTKALADAKMGKTVSEATNDANKDKLNADYQVAAQKCDALAGDAKSGCINAAKARFGKT